MGVPSASAADFSVTSPDVYEINGIGNDPDITLTRGVTYTFDINTFEFHPFEIVSDPFSGDPYNEGVVNNNIYNGTITFTVPADAPDPLYYICSIHFFGGTIHIVDPAPPPVPSVKVVSISLTQSNITVVSTGTNGWTAIPEFSSNLTANVWQTVPGYSNSFSNGTNIMTFSRLDPICGRNVFLRVRNTNP